MRRFSLRRSLYPKRMSNVFLKKTNIPFIFPSVTGDFFVRTVCYKYNFYFEYFTWCCLNGLHKNICAIIETKFIDTNFTKNLKMSQVSTKMEYLHQVRLLRRFLSQKFMNRIIGNYINFPEKYNYIAIDISPNCLIKLIYWGYLTSELSVEIFWNPFKIPLK